MYGARDLPFFLCTHVSLPVMGTVAIPMHGDKVKNPIITIKYMVEGIDMLCAWC